MDRVRDASKQDSGVGFYMADIEATGSDEIDTIPIQTGAFARPKEGRISTRFKGLRTMGTGAYGTVLAITPRDYNGGNSKRGAFGRPSRSVSTDCEGGGRSIEESGPVYACKCVNRAALDKVEQSQMQQEIELLKKCDHPNIIKFYAHYEDAKQIFLVQELCEGGELFDLITDPSFYKGASRLSREKNAAIILKQLLSGVAYLHQLGIVHRDMKPENVLLKNKGDITNLKIIDFGLSAKWRLTNPNGSGGGKSLDPEELLHEQVGTPYYIAPEVLEKNYGPKCDIWSLGVILYVLICGQAPFWGSDDRTILRKVREKKYVMQGDIWNQASPEVKDLITRMLTYPPKNRISAKDALKHPWFKLAMAEEGSSNTFEGLANVLCPTPKPTSDLAAFVNLRKLHGYNKLQNAVRLCIGYHANKDSDINDLTNVFKKMDLDGNGILDRAEFIAAYSETKNLDGSTDGPALTADMYAQEANKAFDRIDLNHDGYIAISEWLAATLDDEYLQNEDRLRDAFSVFDIDGNGKIEINELLDILGLGKDSQNEAVRASIKQFIKSCDVNDDGCIDFAEFCTILKQPQIIDKLST